ncbi:MAG: ABC transporter substrate-binding protein [Gallionella sp.]|nr:ABC transporter substrate-binding protein [Gallionella sp.]MCK9353545.1 ABC transporter substrate-binding protein [Gallionella sp.]
MPRIKLFPTLAAFLATLLLLAAYSVHAATPAESGKRIYREGLLPSGEPLRGKVSNGVVLSGGAAACATCHRRSGLGGGEGRNAVRPIAGRLLFDSPQDKPAPGLFSPYVAAEDRPAYTHATLLRALREGVTPAGRTLDALMPRYALSGKEVAQLAAYLKQLSPLSVPGVTASDIHFATVVAPDVPPAQEEAMLAVLRAFFGDKNGGTRQERRRREVGRNVVGSEQMYRGYRNWQLHVWRLDGAPESWPAQLERHYRQQPVFALLSGIGAGDWQPMHEFCERNEIPCLFPNADFPPDDAEGYSSFYFSRGLALEAEVLAKHLYDEEQDGAIVQVYRDDAGGRASAQALRAAMLRNGFDTLVDHQLDGDRPVPEASWIQLINDERPNTLILWLDDADIAEFPVGLEAPPWLNGLYVSGSLVSQTGGSRLAEGWRDKIRIVYPFELKEHMAQRLLRMEAWLRVRNIAPADTRIQANAFFAATIAGDALAHMDENFSRDYFIERVEHMTEQSLFPSVYPRLSLGPGQRFASRGGYVTGYTQDSGQRIVPLSDWIVP